MASLRNTLVVNYRLHANFGYKRRMKAKNVMTNTLIGQNPASLPRASTPTSVCVRVDVKIACILLRVDDNVAARVVHADIDRVRRAVVLLPTQSAPTRSFT